MFLINNPNAVDIEYLDGAARETHNEGGLAAYLVWQAEAAPTTGTLHIQGYIALNRKLRFASAAFRSLVGGRAAIEIARGTPEECRAYCTKEDSRATADQRAAYAESAGLDVAGLEGGEFGTLPVMNRGERNDLHKVAKLLKDGCDLTKIAETCPTEFIKFSKGFKELKFYLDKKKGKEWRALEVEILNGRAGCGKTRTAIQEANEAGRSWFILAPGQAKGTLWFDGYEGEDVLILDEFRPTWCPYSYLLRVLDGHPFQAQVKGSTTWARWTKVVITTTHPWRTWYDVSDTATGELERRITRIRNLEADPGTDGGAGSAGGGEIQTPPPAPPRALPESGVIPGVNAPSGWAEFYQPRVAGREPVDLDLRQHMSSLMSGLSWE